MVAAGAVGACGGAPPERETLYLGYSVVDRVLHADDRELALAVDSTADLQVVEPHNLAGGAWSLGPDDARFTQVRAAQSTAPEIVRVASIRDQVVRVEAGRPGTADLHFETDLGNRTFRVSVGHPAEVSLSHALWNPAGDGESPVFLEGGTARFRMLRRDSAGHPLGGSSRSVPVHSDPPHNASMSIRDGDPEHLDVRFERVGIMTLRPVGGPPLSIEVVPAEQVMEFLVSAYYPGEEESERPLGQIEPGQSQLVALTLRRENGQRILAVIGSTGLDSLSSGVCTVMGAERYHGDGVHTVTAEANGECRLRAYYGEQDIEVNFRVGPATDEPSSEEREAEPASSESAALEETAASNAGP